MDDKTRAKYYAQLDDKLTVYDITRIEGIDWAADIYLRENLDAEFDIEHHGSAESHYVELIVDDCGGTKVTTTMTVNELDQLTKMLNGLLKEYKSKYQKLPNE